MSNTNIFNVNLILILIKKKIGELVFHIIK